MDDRPEAPERPAALRSHELAVHPDCAPGPVRRIRTGIGWAPVGKRLLVRFRLDGALTQLAIPDPRPPQREDELWQHTCFEVFLRPRGDQVYYELNFSPSMAWAAYEFGGRRQRHGNLALPSAPRIQLRYEPERLELFAEVDVAADCELAPTRACYVGLAAVIEDAQGSLSYWALRHGPGKPDFHDPDSFTLRIPDR